MAEFTIINWILVIRLGILNVLLDYAVKIRDSLYLRRFIRLSPAKFQIIDWKCIIILDYKNSWNIDRNWYFLSDPAVKILKYADFKIFYEILVNILKYLDLKCFFLTRLHSRILEIYCMKLKMFHQTLLSRLSKTSRLKSFCQTLLITFSNIQY